MTCPMCRHETNHKAWCPPFRVEVKGSLGFRVILRDENGITSRFFGWKARRAGFTHLRRFADQNGLTPQAEAVITNVMRFYRERYG